MTEYFKILDNDVNLQVDAFIEFMYTFFDIDIVAIYILGSHTDNTAVSTSDIDLAVVYDNTDKAYIEKINQFFSAYSRNLFKTEIDLYLITLDQLESLDKSQLLTREGIVNVKLVSKLLRGEDIRGRISISNVNDYIQITIETPSHFMKEIRGLSVLDELNVNYPDEADYYFGYLKYTGETHLSLETKPLLTLIGWIATSLVALRSGKLIGKKSDVVKFYTRYVGDEWTDYISNAYNLIRNHLAYRLPVTKKEKEAIRQICEKLPLFEQYYVREYEKYQKQ